MLLTKNLAIDLGSSNTRVYVEGRGTVLNEPSVVAFNAAQREVIAVGRRIIGSADSAWRRY